MTLHNQDAFADPIELKSDDGNPAVDGHPADVVTAALNEFKSTLDDRLQAIETKSKARLDAIEARVNRPGAVIETKAGGDFERKAFRSFLARGDTHVTADERKMLTVSGDGTAAGFLAPTQFGDELIKLLVQYSPIRSYAKKVSIAGPSIKYPRRTASLSATWTAETATRTPSQPTFEQITLTPFELQTYVDVSMQLLEDNSYDLEGELLSEFAEQFGKTEGAAFINGDGATKPVGILNNTGIASFQVPVATFPILSDFVTALIEFYHVLPTVYANSGAWMMNRNTLAYIRLLKDNMGRPLFQADPSQGFPWTLLGRPVIEAIDMPDLGTVTYAGSTLTAVVGRTPIIFGDFQGYRIVDRVQPQILRDPFTSQINGCVRFWGRKRVGGDVTHPDRFVKMQVVA